MEHQGAMGLAQLVADVAGVKFLEGWRFQNELNVCDRSMKTRNVPRSAMAGRGESPLIERCSAGGIISLVAVGVSPGDQLSGGGW